MLFKRKLSRCSQSAKSQRGSADQSANAYFFLLLQADYFSKSNLLLILTHINSNVLSWILNCGQIYWHGASWLLSRHGNFFNKHYLSWSQNANWDFWRDKRIQWISYFHSTITIRTETCILYKAHLHFVMVSLLTALKLFSFSSIEGSYKGRDSTRAANYLVLQR